VDDDEVEAELAAAASDSSDAYEGPVFDEKNLEDMDARMGATKMTFREAFESGETHNSARGGLDDRAHLLFASWRALLLSIYVRYLMSVSIDPGFSAAVEIDVEERAVVQEAHKIIEEKFKSVTENCQPQQRNLVLCDGLVNWLNCGTCVWCGCLRGVLTDGELMQA